MTSICLLISQCETQTEAIRGMSVPGQPLHFNQYFISVSHKGIKLQAVQTSLMCQCSSVSTFDQTEAIVVCF